MLAAVAVYWQEKNVDKILIVVIVISWLASATLFTPDDMVWIMLFPLIMILNSATNAHKAILAAVVMSIPLLTDIISSTDYVNESMVVLLALLISFVVFLNDHQDSQQKELPRHVSDEQFVALINSMADGVLAIDKDRRIRVYNGAALNILNVNVSLEGKQVENYLPLINKKGRAVNLATKIKNMRGYFVSRDFSLVFPDSDNLNLYIGITPVASSYGHKDSGYVILLRDITKEKTLEEERDEFISVISHELRTPAAITEGNISNAQMLLASKAKRDKISEALVEAHKQAVFLASLINDLATLSRAERGVLKVDPEEIKVNEFLKVLGKDFTPEAATKGLRVKVITNKKLKTLTTSRLYLHEVLQNFITNSIKYTNKGVITVSAEPADNGVTFSVKDTGIGISKSDVKHVFDKFFRSEDYRTRENSGTGLGLYVTMKLVRLLDAKVEVQSALDEGSEFKITVPNFDGPAGDHVSS